MGLLDQKRKGRRAEARLHTTQVGEILVAETLGIVVVDEAMTVEDMAIRVTIETSRALQEGTITKHFKVTWE